MAKSPTSDTAFEASLDNRRSRLTEEQREEVRRRLADPDPDMATEEQVEAVFNRYR